MKNLIFSFLAITTILYLFSSCEGKRTTDDFQLDFGYEYFPLEVGKYREYQVDSIVYDFIDGLSDTIQSRTYTREEITDTLTDELGRLGYIVQRSEKKSLDDDWQIKDIWFAVRTEEQAESLEENLRFIKMIFPVKAGTVWDGNRFIDATTIVPIAGESVEVFKSWEYIVEFVDEPIAVSNVLYENALEITQADNENLIELRESKEQYVLGVGLAYREMRILDTQCTQPECDALTWEEKAEKGFILFQSLIAHN